MNGEIVIEDLRIGYRMGHGRLRVVAEGLSATLVSGELTCLVGRNGTGKSTLLRTLSGLQAPLGGRISFGHRSMPPSRSRSTLLSALPLSCVPWVPKEVSIVLTEQPDLHNLSVMEVVAMGRMPYTNFWGTLTEEDCKAVNEAMELVGIAHMAGQDIATLSDGEREKVMIAKALAQQTRIIILDEPTAFLDYASKREVMSLLRVLAHEQEKSILLSTHDVDLAESFGDRIWLMGSDGLQTVSAHELRELIVLALASVPAGRADS